MDDLKQSLCGVVDEVAPYWIGLSDRIHANPETKFQEFKASRWLSTEFTRLGFKTELGTGGLPTAFVATLDSGRSGPTVGVILEYDALEGLGHACAHNTKGPAVLCGVEAFLKSIPSFKGKIVAFGCPAEEGGGGKVTMGTAGVFDSVDVCLELACGPTFATGLKFFASQGVSLVLRGQAGHSGIRHLRGINAVDAMMFVAGSLDYLRANIGERGIVNFTIKESRSALAAGRVGIRATTTDLAAAYVGHVKRLAELARDVSGARLEVKDEIGYRENVKCPSLAHMIMNNFQVLGFDAEWHLDKEPQGSSDVGDVSHRVPTESIRIGLGQGLVPHTDAYREAAGGEPGHRVVVNGGKALCACLVDLLVYDSSGLVERARAEFKNNCSV